MYVKAWIQSVCLGIYFSCSSCNVGTRDLPDMYAWKPRVAGPRADNIRVRQIRNAYVTSNMYHFRPAIYNSQTYNLLLCVFIKMGSCCDYGIFILLLQWHLFIHCTVLVLIMGFSKNMCYSFYLKTLWNDEFNKIYNW